MRGCWFTAFSARRYSAFETVSRTGCTAAALSIVGATTHDEKAQCCCRYGYALRSGESLSLLSLALKKIIASKSKYSSRRYSYFTQKLSPFIQSVARLARRCDDCERTRITNAQKGQPTDNAIAPPSCVHFSLSAAAPSLFRVDQRVLNVNSLLLRKVGGARLSKGCVCCVYT